MVFGCKMSVVIFLLLIFYKFSPCKGQMKYPGWIFFQLISPLRCLSVFPQKVRWPIPNPSSEQCTSHMTFHEIAPSMHFWWERCVCAIMFMRKWNLIEWRIIRACDFPAGQKRDDYNVIHTHKSHCCPPGDDTLMSLFFAQSASARLIK